MVKLKNKADKSDYWDTKQDENEDFISISDRGGPDKNRGGVAVLRKAKNEKERETFRRVNKKLLEAEMKAIDKKWDERNENIKKKGDSKFFPVKTTTKK